ncbi:MAG: proprotein convertase P-domain-containing protein [Pseudomonadota bacterium]|nr:proprotein convertase P-domain-containing protein [Pseudomonadota bacterium]
MSTSITTRQSLAALAFVCCLAPAASLLAGESPREVPRQPVTRIAELRDADHTLDLKRSPTRQFEVRTPDASFIKIHFDYLNLPKGMAVEVFNPDGSEVYRYTNEQRDGYTVDKALGQNGFDSFSALSISGPVANVRLVGKAQEPWTSIHGVRVSRVLEGYPEDMLESLQHDDLLAGPVTKAICGSNDKRAVACYAASDATAVDRSRPVARLVMSGGGLCTAWRVGSGNHLFTNNHCFTTTAEVAAAEVWFNYQATTCAGTTSGTTTKVTGASMLKTDPTLDYTLFSVNNLASLASFGYLGLDARLPTLGEEIFIPQHPGGRIKELATVSDHVGGARCRIDTATQNGSGTNTDAGYKCDTEGGSSGSPVVARSSNKVIALHHLGGCNNSGAHISKIWPQVSSFFGGVVPGGDTGTPSNAAPTANFSFTTSALTAAFTDSSTDSDGTIASRSWNFGDSTTSTTINPSKTYSAAGTYNVSLTVTDNGGATNSKSSAVTVTSGTANNILTNGVAKTGLAAATGSELVYVLSVPTGATGLKFVTTGGTGDADMYVKFASAPTDTVYDCRPFLGGNAETCNIATAQVGTYYVRLKAYSAFSGVSLTGSYNTGGGTSFFQNTADFSIGDNATVNSPIVVSGRSGNAPATLSVAVNIVHTYQGDLKVDLVAPDGTLYNIHNYTGAGTDNIVKTVSINASSEVANGTWNLRVNDNAAGDTGYINSWSMQF